MSPPDSIVIVGKFGKTFGVSGWIKVISFTTPKENILKFQPWLIQKNGNWEELFFADGKKHFDSLVVKLPGCNFPEEVKLFTNIKIGVLREQLPKLPSDEFYWADLVGLEVINQDGVNLGKVADLIATGANDVLVVTGEHKRLIPYVSHVITDVDLINETIHVDWEDDF